MCTEIERLKKKKNEPSIAQCTHISDVSDDKHKHKHELVIQAHPSFVFSPVAIKAKRKWSFGISCNLEHSKKTISIVFEAFAELINLS